MYGVSQVVTREAFINNFMDYTQLEIKDSKRHVRIAPRPVSNQAVLKGIPTGTVYGTGKLSFLATVVLQPTTEKSVFAENFYVKLKRIHKSALQSKLYVTNGGT